MLSFCASVELIVRCVSLRKYWSLLSALQELRQVFLLVHSKHPCPLPSMLWEKLHLTFFQQLPYNDSQSNRIAVFLSPLSLSFFFFSLTTESFSPPPSRKEATSPHQCSILAEMEATKIDREKKIFWQEPGIWSCAAFTGSDTLQGCRNPVLLAAWSMLLISKTVLSLLHLTEALTLWILNLPPFLRHFAAPFNKELAPVS